MLSSSQKWLYENFRSSKTERAAAVNQKALNGDCAHDRQRYDGLTKKARTLRWSGQLANAKKILREAQKLEPKCYDAFNDMYIIYADDDENWIAAEYYLLKTLELDPSPVYYAQVVSTLRKSQRSDEFIESYFRSKGLSFSLSSQESPWDFTKGHYQYVYDTLKQSGIPYVVMQYPTLSVELFRNFLPQDKGLYFVSNEESFRKAIAEHGYGALFTDEFAVTEPHLHPLRGKYGHATRFGQQLIAKNAFNTIAPLIEQHQCIFRDPIDT